MSSSVLFYAMTALFTALTVNAGGQYPATPLASKHFTYPSGIPQKVDTDTGLDRGPQAGYNICNSATEGPNSLCQTSWVNSADDFCLWAPQKPGSVIGDIEGETVAWCSRAGHGTRVIPPGAITGLQFIRTPAYVQVVGFVDQTKIDIQAGDSGGEMDPHGADLRGNPMGGIMFSSAFGGGIKQAIEWANFMGSNTFCIKVCDPANAHAADFCEHIYDRIGCEYNMPNQAQDHVFESCLGENQDYPGVYTDSAGKVQTYHQPGENTVPTPESTYTPRMPKSSSCVKYESAVLFGGGPVETPTFTGGGATTTKTLPITSSGTGTSSTAPGLVTVTSLTTTTPTADTTRPTTSPAVQTSAPNPSTSAAATTTGTGGKNAAEGVAAMSAISIVGIVFSAMFLS